MKGYKLLVPFALAALFAVSVYMAVNTNMEKEETYNRYLEAAREYRSQGILVDAEQNYKMALEGKPSLALYMEIGDFYRESAQESLTQEWADIIMKEFPKQPEGYEFAMSFYADRDDYAMCFRIYDTFTKRGLASEYVSSQIKDIWYTFFFRDQYEDVSVFSGGYCAVMSNGLWGYVGEDGSRLIEQQYHSAGPFFGDLAAVVDQDGSLYYIDTLGNKKLVVSEIENVSGIGPFYNDMLSACSNGKWSFYDREGKKLFGEYDDCSALGNGYAAASVDGKWGLVDGAGNVIIPFSHDGIVMDEKGVACRNDRVFLEDNYGYYLADCQGNLISQTRFEDARLFNDGTYAAVKVGTKWGFIDKDGNMVLEPAYEDARSFSGGMAAVRFGGKWGLIDSEFEMAVSPRFEDMKDMNGSGCVYVKDEEGWKLLKFYAYHH